VTTWSDIEAQLEAAPYHQRVRVGLGELPHPRDAGARESTGLPAPGKIADWRFPPTASCQGLHVHQLADGWVAHLDQVHPACDPVEHLRVDAPGFFVALTSAAGGVIGSVARGPLGGLVGGLLGSVFGLVVTHLPKGNLRP
jgi:hypothetical protein